VKLNEGFKQLLITIIGAITFGVHLSPAQKHDVIYTSQLITGVMGSLLINVTVSQFFLYCRVSVKEIVKIGQYLVKL